MKYITLDTCVWLELLKADLHNDDNVFEEMCYWIEHKFLTHITPENLIREWDRRKVKKSQEIIKNIKDLEKTTIGALKGNPDLISAYKPDAVSGKINKRIERVDLILKVHSEIAKENLTVYKDAIKRNLDCLAPNHRADSFRDTINILSLTDYIIKKGYEKCCFSTIN